MIFEEKSFSLYILLTDHILLTIFFVWLSLLFELSSNTFIVIVIFPICDAINWNLPEFSYQTVFLHDQKSKDKNLNNLREKRLLRWNNEHFSSFVKGI